MIIDKDKILVTDDGMTYDYLFMNGIDLFGKSNARKYNLDIILNKNETFIYQQNEIAVYVKNKNDLGLAINRLIRSITSIQHFVYTIKEMSVRTFKEEVAEMLFRNKVEYRQDFVIQGKTKEHKLDFYLERNNRKIVFKTLSTESAPYARRIAMETAFIFIDISELNPLLFKVSLIDDFKDVWNADTNRILTSYSDKMLRWTKREEILELIA